MKGIAVAPIISLALAISCGRSYLGPGEAAYDSLDPLPPWNYEEMAQVALHATQAWDVADVVDLRLLAWHGMIDDRPVHVEQALFWIALQSVSGGRRWALVQLGRNPNRDDVSSEWSLYRVMDVPWEPVRIFDHAPSNEDVRAFLQFWEFAPGLRFRFVTRGIRAGTWVHVIGEKPTVSYEERSAA